MADFSLNVKINGADQAINTVAQIEQALRATKEELKNVEIGSQSFDQLSKQAVVLQRELVNSYKETTNFNKNIAELGQSVGNLASTVTAGFTIATSAFALFGSESEDLSKAQVKAQQALALALSATTIATNAKTLAEDLGNVATALGISLTGKKAQASTAAAVATGAEAIATEGAAVAQESLNVALASNPIGLVLVALSALIGALVLFSGEEKTAKTNIDATTGSLLEQAAANRKANDDFVKVYKQRREIDLLNAKTEEEKVRIRKETEETLSKITGEANEYQKKLVEEANTKILGEFEKYKAAFIGEKQELVSVTNEYDEFGVMIGQQENFKTVSYKVGEETLKQLDANLKSRQETIKKNAKDRGLTEDETNLQLLEAQTDYQIQYLKSQQEFLKSSTQNEDKTLAENLQKTIDSLTKTRGEYQKYYADLILQQQQAEQQRLEEEKKKQEEAARKYQEYLNKRKAAQKQANDDIFALNQELEENDQVRAQAALQKKLSDELTELKKSYKEKLITKKEYDTQVELLDKVNKKNLADLDREYRLKSLEAQSAAAIALEKALIASQISLNKTIKDKDTENEKERTLITAEALKERLKTSEDSYNAELAKFIEIESQKQIELDKFNADATNKNDDVNRKRLEAEVTTAKAQTDIFKTEYLNKKQDLLNSYLAKEADVRIAALQKDLLIAQGYDENEKKLLDKRYEALKSSKFKETKETIDAAEIQINILKEQQAKELLNTELTRAEAKAIEEKYAQQIYQIRKDATDKSITAEKQSLDALSATLFDLASKTNNAYAGLSANITKSITDIIALQDQEFKNAGDKIAAYTNAIAGALSGIISNLSQIFSDFYANELNNAEINANQRKDVITSGYNSEIESLKAKLDQGLIDETAYNDAVKNLDYAYSEESKKIEQDRAAKELEIKKKAFQADKALKITQAIIAGAQGAVQAFASAMVIPPPAGQIIGGVLVGVIAALTAAQIAIISKQQFNPGQTVPQASSSLPPSASGSLGGAGAVNQASTGGFTGFSPSLTGPSFGTPGAPPQPGGTTGPMKVYVVESDITNSQNRVRTLESNATFG